MRIGWTVAFALAALVFPSGFPCHLAPPDTGQHPRGEWICRCRTWQEEQPLTDDIPIWIGNDHGGFELKSSLVKWLAGKGIPTHDLGCGSSDIVRYPYYAAQVAEAIVRGKANRGILICSTGIGMSIIANRYRGVRASLCTSAHMGKMTRAHNDSNLLCLGGAITPVDEALKILEAWLTTPYEGGRHDISLGLIRDAEATISSCGVWEPADPMAPGKGQP